MASVRLLAGDGTADPAGRGRSEWLRFVHEVNGIDAIFGEPESTGPWWAGGDVEEYADARIIHRGDGSVSIVGKTERGDKAILAAAERMHVNGF